MGQFSASLKTVGDRRGLPATISLEDNRLSIAAGDESIGDWDLSEIQLERAGNGYRMAAEGEQLMIELPNPDEFADELATTGKAPKITMPAKESLLKPVDKSIEAAENKLGGLLPEWMFTRVMFGVVAVALILMLIVPGLVSSFLLIAGVLTIMFGAVVYTDSMLATRWLPGRMTPMHVLLFGVVILLLGIVLGIIAS